MYQPTSPPDPMDPFQAWLMRELMAISQYLSGKHDYVELMTHHSAPVKPRENMVVAAPGDPGWNPGAGAGPYVYNGGVWRKLF